MVSIAVPIGPKPGWELENDRGEIKSVEDSQVLRYTLVQSRERWLSSAFPLFSSRTRVGRPPRILPEKHTSRLLGTCELEIGVARFQDTSFFEINYVQNSALLHFQNVRDATPTPRPSSSAVPVITETTLSQVNALASVNPRVAELLQLAHTSQATPEQLRELGNMVNTIMLAPNSSTPSEMIVEFRERSGQRWVIPKEHAFSEEEAMENKLVIKTVLMNSHHNPEPVTLTLHNPSPDIRQFITRWVGGSDLETRKKTWATLAEKRDRESGFLQHRLTDGPLHTTIRKASEPKYTMESIDPAKARRATAVRRVSAAEPTPREPIVKGKDKDVETAVATTSAVGPPTKRRKSNATGAPVTSAPKTPRRKGSALSCDSCGQQDVPLLYGGKFCRPCIANGVAGAAASQSSDTIVFKLQE